MSTENNMENRVTDVEGAPSNAQGTETSNEAEDEQLMDVGDALDNTLGKDFISDKPAAGRIVIYLLIIFFVFFGLYFFLCSIAIMGNSFKCLTGTGAGSIFGSVKNPIAGLMVGIIATVLVQSSSTTTTIITILTGEGVIPIPTAIPMIMGSNIGTSVTNSIVAFTLVVENPKNYERGFAGATVHDMFNYLNVLTLLPLELIVDACNKNGGGLLEIISRASVPDNFGGEGKPDNKIKEWTSKVVKGVIEVNKYVIYDYAKGRPEDDDCNEDPNFEYKFKNKKVEYKAVQYCVNGTVNETLLHTAQQQFDDARLLKGGIFYEKEYSDTAGGVCALLLSFFLMISSLFIMVKALSTVAKGPGREYMRKALNLSELLPKWKIITMTNLPGWLTILAGTGITFFVQSSSITTSVLTPLVAAGILDLENMYPFTLGANIGTTTTALLAAIASQLPLSLQIALVHFYFNIFGVLIWFPIPFMRNVPLGMARFLGKMTYVSRFFPLYYILILFLVYPAILFGIFVGFNSDASTAAKVLSSIFFIIFVGFHFAYLFWYKKRGGKAKVMRYLNLKLKQRLDQIRQKHEDNLNKERAETTSSQGSTDDMDVNDNTDKSLNIA